jgi:hypothetical protein
VAEGEAPAVIGLPLAIGYEQGDQAQYGVTCDPSRDNEGVAGRTGSGPRRHHRQVECDYRSQCYDRASC